VFDIPGLEAGRDLLHYKVVAAVLLFRFVRIMLVWRHPRHRMVDMIRPPSDANWFLPVYVWGLESLCHVRWLGANIVRIMESEGGLSIQKCFCNHAVLSAAILVVVLTLCFMEESLARTVGLPARAGQATLPLPVLGVMFGVMLNWDASAMVLMH